MFDREYGSLATIGITVPQANTTVEPEMTALMPDGVSMLIGRLQGCRENSRNRLLEYLDNFGETLSDFDTAPLDAVGYACTATSYLIGAEQEERRIGEFSAKAGFPIVTAAQAIRAALQHLGAQKMALFAPYPARPIGKVQGSRSQIPKLSRSIPVTHAMYIESEPKWFSTALNTSTGQTLMRWS